MEPKYVLVYEKNSYGNPFIIYEQMATPQEPEDVPVGFELTMKRERPPIISKRAYATFDRFETALRAFNSLDDEEPIILAYSTKTVDNTFTV